MLRCDHVVIPVEDAATSLAFYRDLLGLPLLDAITGDDWGGFPWLMMIFGLADDRQLVLVAFRGAPSPPANALPRDARHYAFSVDTSEELDAWRSRLRKRYMEFWEEDHGNQRSIYFEDPSANVLEITTPPSPETPTVNPRAADEIDRWLRGL